RYDLAVVLHSPFQTCKNTAIATYPFVRKDLSDKDVRVVGYSISDIVFPVDISNGNSRTMGSMSIQIVDGFGIDKGSCGNGSALKIWVFHIKASIQDRQIYTLSREAGFQDFCGMYPPIGRGIIPIRWWLL